MEVYVGSVLRPVGPFQAGHTNLYWPWNPTHYNPCFLQVWQPAPLCVALGMADTITVLRAFPAYIASSRQLPTPEPLSLLFT